MGKSSPEDPAGFIRHDYFPVIELSAMMPGYFAYSQDRDFVKNTLFPMAPARVTLNDQHFKRDSNGKLFMSPVNSVETFWKVNKPSPDIARLKSVLQGLLALALSLTSEASRLQWKRLPGDLPEISLTSLKCFTSHLTRKDERIRFPAFWEFQLMPEYEKIADNIAPTCS